MHSIEEVLLQIQNNYNVPRETLTTLNVYVDLIEKWNQKINLVSYHTPDELWNRHVLDSAQLIKYIDKEAYVADLGSGAGFPGVVLSILGIKRVLLIEADNRKAVFLHQAGLLSANKITIINDRIENLTNLNVDIITSRALCNITKLFTLIATCQNNAKILLLKGKTVGEEIEEAEKEWSFNYTLHPSITSIESFIVEIHNLKHK